MLLNAKPKAMQYSSTENLAYSHFKKSFFITKVS